MNPWKACDIRGVFPDEVSPDLLRRVGAGVASTFPLHARILIAGDFRESTPLLKAALAAGLLGAGAHVVDAGQLPTPVAYFAHAQWKTDAVLMVTASHNPATYNGLKLMLGDLPPTPTELAELHRRVDRGDFRKLAGTVEALDPVPAYRNWIQGRWGKATADNPLRVVLDAGNGAWAELAPQIFEALGFRVHRLFCEIDGRFPHRSPDCARPVNLSALRKKVKETHAALGIAWDGDGDRVAFVDETGSVVPSDAIAVLWVRHLLRHDAGAKVVYDIKMSDIVRRTVLESGGVPILERSGHTFLKRRMITDSCLFGCEVSGHYFFRELRGGDDGVFAALFLADMVNRSGSLHAMRESVAPVFATPDLRVPAAALPFGEIARRLRHAFGAAKETTLDGLRLEMPEGSVLARESVTEPIVTMRIEGSSPEDLHRLVETCLRIFPEVLDRITEQIRQAKGL